jgi:hypothetical protein
VPKRREAHEVPGLRTSISDNDAYPDFCWRAATDSAVFADFRRQPVYLDIVGLDPKWGWEYFRALTPESRAARLLPALAQGDRVGDPLLITLPEGHEIAPTTLRYVKVAEDLERLFGDLDGVNVCEIGVGYGGQCRVLDAMWSLESYTLVDLRPVLLLADRFLMSSPLRCELHLRTMNELGAEAYDLLISNYSFSELAEPVQEAYFHKTIARTPRGYVAFNEIRTAALGAGMTATELCRRVGGRILPEEPQTHSRNCLIVWGERRP